jgi:hypothetical protein
MKSQKETRNIFYFILFVKTFQKALNFAFKAAMMFIPYFTLTRPSFPEPVIPKI